MIQNMSLLTQKLRAFFTKNQPEAAATTSDATTKEWFADQWRCAECFQVNTSRGGECTKCNTHYDAYTVSKDSNPLLKMHFFLCVVLSIISGATVSSSPRQIFSAVAAAEPTTIAATVPSSDNVPFDNEELLHDLGIPFDVELEMLLREAEQAHQEALTTPRLPEFHVTAVGSRAMATSVHGFLVVLLLCVVFELQA
ncbi:hypothetical protein AeRB84_001279 [Aphanomyces euteiches]|nr:hypothetical protein AeRB84_001279 [Aphanomyces euteiches]